MKVISLLLLLLPVGVFAWTLPCARRASIASRATHFQHQSPTVLAVTRLKTGADASIKEEDEEEESKDMSNAEIKISNTTLTTNESAGDKVRRLKDLMWARETLEDLTAAEFACTVEAVEDDKNRRKRAVDYEKLVTQLNKRIRDLGCEGGPLKKQDDKEVAVNCVLTPGVGMGSVVYTNQERTALMERIIMTRHLLLQVIRENELDLEETSLDLPFKLSLPDLRSKPSLSPLGSVAEEEEPKVSGPKLYVRDDGTVDWDGALQDQAALRKFGTAVWARINGRDPESLEEEQQHAEPPTKEVTAKIVETPQIINARERLADLKEELKEQESLHLALLNSAIRAGQAVANVKLAALEPELRNKIRGSAASLELMKEKVSFQTLIYELERIYTYLLGELGNPSLKGYIPLQDRLNVAEFGLLAVQIDSLNQQLDAEQGVDADVLAVVMEQLTDFKRRLGIDYYVTGVSLDVDGIKRWTGELLDKTKKGLAFYVKGVRLFGNDMVYCFSLINRAAQGYTLKPREVRTLRRTFKDIITFIPVVIILIIPLSPVGHVLVFGAIQRFFPDFFPSCFTEQRQNLLQLYESAEYSEFTINENTKEKMSRIIEAILFAIANTSRSLYSSLISAAKGGNEEKKDN